MEAQPPTGGLQVLTAKPCSVQSARRAGVPRSKVAGLCAVQAAIVAAFSSAAGCHPCLQEKSQRAVVLSLSAPSRLSHSHRAERCHEVREASAHEEQGSHQVVSLWESCCWLCSASTPDLRGSPLPSNHFADVQQEKARRGCRLRLWLRSLHTWSTDGASASHCQAMAGCTDLNY